VDAKVFDEETSLRSAFAINDEPWGTNHLRAMAADPNAGAIPAADEADV
jgi:hypothetical protein